MRLISAVFILISVSVVPAAAQSADPPRYEAAGGYQFMRDQDIAKQDPDLSANFPLGWVASGGAHLWGWVGAIGEVSGSYKTLSIPGDKPKLRVYTFMAGPRFTRTAHPGVNPFAQLLFGSARASTSVLGVRETVTDFSCQPGGGIDLNTARRLGLRLEGDYRIVRESGHNSKEPRVIAAAVIGF
jgi:outer membrane protein with beta-barrel domain